MVFVNVHPLNLQVFHVFDTLDNAVGADAKLLQEDHGGSRSGHFPHAHLLDHEVAFVTHDLSDGIADSTLNRTNYLLSHIIILLQLVPRDSDLQQQGFDLHILWHWSKCLQHQLA